MNIRKPEHRTKRVAVRMTPSQYAALEGIAEHAEVTVSDLVRQAVDGLASASTVAGPAFEGLVDGSPAEQLAALEVLRLQAEQFAAVGRQMAESYVSLRSQLEAKIEAAAQAAEQEAS